VLLVVEPDMVVWAAARESKREIGRREIYIVTECLNRKRVTELKDLKTEEQDDN
jgi:hypothetical protein